MLSLVDKLSDISFCDKKCSNVNNNEFKEDFIRMIDEKYDIKVVDKLYVFLNPSILKNVSYHEHILSTLTNGNPYLLYLTRIDNVNCCFYIDRKLKGGFSFPKIHCVKYQFHDELFNDTMFSGELVRDRERKWFFLIDNLLVYKGENTKNRNIITRFELIYDIFNNFYNENTSMQPCSIQIKKLFTYNQAKMLINKFIPNLSYYCKGLVFYNLNTKYSNYSMLFPRNKKFNLISPTEITEKIKIQKPTLWAKTINISNVKQQHNETSIHMEENNELPVSNDKTTVEPNNVIFKILHTNMPDVYNLYIYNEKKTELIKFDYALVPNLKTSKLLNELFKGNKDTLNICMECKYSKIFKKWTPIRQILVDKPYSIMDLEKCEL
jgi:hypothetical protein